MANEEKEYAVLFKKNILDNETYVFIPINVVVGVTCGPEFLDEVGNYYVDITEIMYDETNSDFYVGYSIFESELEEKYNTTSKEILKMNYFNEFKNSIFIGNENYDTGDLDIKIIDTKNINEKKQNDILNENEEYDVTLNFNMETFKQIINGDLADFKRFLESVINGYEVKEVDEPKIEYILNQKYIYMNIISGITNNSILVNYERKYKFNNTDIDLEKLLNISKSIQDLYIKLYNLEIKNKKDTIEYNKTIDYLNIALDTENFIYRNLDLNFTKALILLKYILNNTKIKRIPSNEITATFISDTNMYISRIINLLRPYILEQYDVFTDYVQDDLFNLLLIITKYATEDYDDRYIIENFEMTKYFENQLTKDILYNTSRSKNKNIIKFKYMTSFLNKEIESDLISYNFDTNINYYKLDKIYNLKYDNELFKDIKNEFGKETFTDAIFSI